VARERNLKQREGNEIEFSRIVAFSDGVFAIAITLLVLNLTIDKGLTGSQLTEELLNNWDNLIAYAISFAVIGRFWVVHHRFFSEVRAFDGRLLGLNLLYLAWVVLIPFSSQVLGDYGGETPSVVVYSVNLAAVVLVGLWMSVDARRRGLTAIDDEAHRENRVRSTYIAGIFLLSIPLGFVAPRAAPYLWLLLFLDPSSRLANRFSSCRCQPRCSR
jgi:TMEM175 potassium channel family protein